ncbi:MAG TPA: type II toxin-antitoxin system VapC family toxin [Verrucomicrobiae bacterium]|nr:type II toxin-antitoxin system VapC family toxin [Verrucomicrobiae bacterium]
MIILDVNLLLYAVNRDAPLHLKARTWLESAIAGNEEIGLAWNVILAFLRLTTKPGLFRTPIRPERAFAIIAGWLDQPSVTIVHPGPRHLEILRKMILPLGTAGNLTSDAHLAAMAIGHGAQLCSCDSDFARFPGLDWMNPLK